MKLHEVMNEMRRRAKILRTENRQYQETIDKVEEKRHLAEGHDLSKWDALVRDDIPQLKGYNSSLIEAYDAVLQHKGKWRAFDLGETEKAATVLSQDDLCMVISQERLPFPYCALLSSFHHNGEFQGQIFLFCLQEKDMEEITIIPFWKTSKIEGREITYTGGILELKQKGANWIGEVRSFIYGEDNDPRAESLPAFAALSSNIVLGLMKVLSCKNVRIKTEKYPERLRKRQEKDGKVGGYDEHTLVIDGDEDQKRPSHGGSHASPRLHFRRGHIRRLEKGSIWVRHTMVGKTTGYVNKDYRVTKNLNNENAGTKRT